MKTLIHFIQNLPHPLLNPFNRAALPFFFVLAFLPSIQLVVLHDFHVTNPLAALGPAAAGFWLVAGFRGIRVNYTLLSALMTALLWLANWLMTADANCCSIN